MPHSAYKWRESLVTAWLTAMWRSPETTQNSVAEEQLKDGQQKLFVKITVSFWSEHGPVQVDICTLGISMVPKEFV